MNDADVLHAVGRADAAGRCPICHTRLRRDRTYTLTCDPICHRTLIERVIAQVGETKEVTSVETGKTYLVPMRDILEKGIRGSDLPRYLSRKSRTPGECLSRHGNCRAVAAARSRKAARAGERCGARSQGLCGITNSWRWPSSTWTSSRK